ncbi:MAG TPA: acyl-CoA dehydrogenase family protein, partial [Thermoleophilaceae bacterium]|nr:acyl-CoA dehydrogenase family protein [Thermoleophilaceae bacterium]
MDARQAALGLSLRALNRFAGLELVDRIGLREPAVRALREASKQGFRTAGAAGRTFAAASRLGRPARLPSGPRTGQFDLTPTDEQQMMVEAIGEFGQEQLLPAAQAADDACAPPPELLAQTTELGVVSMSIPEELGGVVSERSAVTSVLIAEALARGDMGLALACLAPTGVSTALTLWGDEDQQARYLREFAGEDVPAAALALLEPRAVFDPFALETTARPADGGGYVLEGVKSIVPRAAEAELFVVGAELEGHGPALFLVESKTEGVSIEPEPAMGVRAAATGRLFLEGVELAGDALLDGGEAETYAECVALARLGWCALAVGTARAVLDHVIPYVNDREAFGEPISHRQAVAFIVADIATELDGMRLVTYRAAAR